MSYKCDICGKNADAEEYTFPVWADMRGGIGDPIIQPKFVIVKGNINLCTDCKKKIADMIYSNKH